ncbi:MAG: CHAT domain-containing protein [Phaeodactylibacter sp.]|nr:CHAT domain-containing protein [Phaeodactylibacter sp.]
MNKPAILLAFANEREEGQRYLRNLPLEMDRLRSALEKAEDRGLCELVILPNTTLDNLIDTFQREKYRNRIAIFHYGGHAGSYELLLEQADGKTQLAHGQGLVPFLAGQKSLQLVFLNGCHSARQAEDLINNGVPAVVGTVGAVDDRIASELASAFYKAMGEGMPLEQAWQEAVHRMKAGEGVRELSRYYQKQITSESNRDMIFDLSTQAEQFPWEIRYRPGAEAIRDWNLPDAANDPYFGLPGIPARYGFPEEPYRFLERYAKEDACIFFGRGSYIRDLYHRIHNPMTAPAILLYGQSGVGKSSLLEAGLFPRLEGEYDIRMFRRQPETGLLGHLAQALEIKEEKPDTAQLLKQWKLLEAQSEKTGLIIVLDQVEEVFTRPADGQPEELDCFLQTAIALFARPDERPAGKLLLSYRKEYDPEIEKACRTVRLPKEKVFLERLDRKGILEIAGGLASNQYVQNKYRLEIEKGLPVLVADDLMEDRNSPIAPVLQIILTKLWQQQEEHDKRTFRVDDYQKLKKEGIMLYDFFHQQMAKIRDWEGEIQQQVESSGLALDMLHYHTTVLGTAESRKLDDLRTRYQHQNDILQQLLARFQSLYLLAGLGPEQTTLAHDTLAPIVQREIRDSDKPGQRALRILNSKMADYVISPERTYIDEEDLALVEAGVGGMRMWTMKERELVEKSRERRAKLLAERKRNRRWRAGLTAAIVALLLVTSFLWWQSGVKARVNGWVAEARALERTDPTLALAPLYQALEKRPDDRAALQALNDLFLNNEFYQALPVKVSKYIRSIRFSSRGDQFLFTSGSNACIWKNSLNGKNLRIDSFPHPQRVYSALFSGDEQAVLTASRDSLVRLWPRGGGTPELFGGESWFYTARFSPDGKGIYGGASNGKVFYWGPDGQRTSWAAHPDGSGDPFQGGVTTLEFCADDSLMLTAGFDSRIYLWNRFTHTRLDSFIYKEGKGIVKLAMAYDSLGHGILAGYRDGLVRLWDIKTRQYTDFIGHTQQVNNVVFSPDWRYILTASGDRHIKLWDRAGHLLKTYKGNEGWVQAIAYSPDGRFFISGGEDYVFRLWRQDSKVAKTLGACGGGVSSGPETNSQETQVSRLKAMHQELLETFARHEGAAAHITALGQRFLAYDDKGNTAVWNLWEEELLLEKNTHDGAVFAGALSPDGCCFATGGADGKAVIQDFSGQELAVLEHPDIVSALAFSPDGKYLLTGCFDGIARRWDIRSGTPKEYPAGKKILTVAYSPAGNYIAAGGTNEHGTDARFFVFKPNGKLAFAGEENDSNPDQAKKVNALAFSSGGQYLLAGSEGGVAHMYSLRFLPQDAPAVTTLNDFGGAAVSHLAFVPGGDEFILAGSSDGCIRIFVNPLKMKMPEHNSWYPFAE